MCTFNGAPYLRQQLESLSRQTRLPDELVVSDDGSTDTTIEILEEFEKAASFSVRIFRNPANLGTTKNFEQTIVRCKGDVIVLADQDDVWLSEKLRVFEYAFTSQPSVDLVFSDAEIVGADLVPLGYTLWEAVGLNEQRQKMMRSHRALDLLLRQNFVTGAAMAFRTRLIRTFLPIPACWMHDAWISINAALVSELLPIAATTLKYRQHGKNQVGITRRPAVSAVCGKSRDSRAYLHIVEETEALLAHVRWLLAEHRIKEDAVAIRAVQDKLRHFQARTREGGRIWIVRSSIAELMSGRYQRFSERGFRSFLKDCFL